MTSTIKMKVWGEYGLFTRPEAKVERVSYPIMTPSAARAILESIFWKPEFNWIVKKIYVLKPIQYYSILRNEVSSIVPSNIQKNRNAFLSDEDRQQRHSLMLRDVEYIIEAEIRLKPTTEDPYQKYEAMFKRRLKKGQCFQRPYFGTRECSVHFSEVEGNEKPLPITQNIGPMLFDLKYPIDNSKEGQSAIPYFFDAQIIDGVMTVPHELYEEVM